MKSGFKHNVQWSNALARFETGLWTEDGEAAGSGYALTEKGWVAHGLGRTGEGSDEA